MSRTARRAGTGASTSTADARPDIWALWRRLVAEHRSSRQLGVSIRSGVAWGMYGMDRVEILRASILFQGVERVTRGLDQAAMDALLSVAEVNAERNDALWRLAVMFYVSLPGALLFASLDIAPDILRELVSANGWVLLTIFVVFTGQMAWYLMTFWRARQIVALLRLVRIERFGGDRP